MEFIFGRIADRPAAHAVVDGENGCEITVVQLDRIFFDDFDRGRRGVDGGAPLRPRPFGARRGGASGKPEPVNLADHGVATDAAERPGNLTGRQTLVPETF